MKLNEGVSAWNQWREKHPEIMPDLRNADLQGRILTGIDFRRTNLDGADLRSANMCSALLNTASLTRADLSGAKLRQCNLCRTYFKETLLQQTNMHRAILLETQFLNVDLSQTVNLETVEHVGPSAIGIDTIQRSKGNISDMFLSGAGVSEKLIACIRASGQAPFDYWTCFISYSSHDQRFVTVLSQDLRKAGVQCWYAPESLKARQKFSLLINEAVQSREKVLVVLSKHSLKSEWVAHEVQLARQKEGNGKREVLLPIRLDNAISTSSIDWAAAIRNKRHILSFENWQQPPQYQKLLKKLLNDLRKE